MRIVDVSDPSNPAPRGAVGVGSETMGRVFVQGNYAYVESIISFGNEKLSIVNVSDVDVPTFSGELPGLGTVFSLAVSGTKAIVATDGSYQILDVTNPALPAFEKAADCPSEVWSICVDGDNMYAGGTDKIYRYSLANPDKPVLEEAYADWSGASRLLVHNGFMYAQIFGQISIINLADPANPVQAATYSAASTVNEIYLQSNYLYLGTAANRVEIIDISTPSNPTKVGDFEIFINTYRTGYRIQDLYVPETGGEIFIAYNCNVTSGPAGGFQIFDISNPAAPVQLCVTDYLYMPTAIWYDADLVYLTSVWGQDGYVYAYDVTDRTAPSRVDMVTLSGCQTWDMEMHNGLLMVSAPYGSIHTYQYSQGAGDMLSGPVGHMPESGEIAAYSSEGTTYVYSTSGHPDYYENTAYGSKGIYTLKIPQGEPGKSYVVAVVSPPEAAADGCTATPTDPVECDGNPVTVTATVADPWAFDGWTGAASGDSLITTADCPEEGTAVAIANFVCPILTLTAGPENPAFQSVHADGTGNNAANQVYHSDSDNYTLTVYIEPPQAAAEGCTTTPGPGIYEYAPGTQVAMSSQTAGRWHFSEWTGDISGNTVTMDGDKIVTARFIKEVVAADIRLEANEIDDWRVSTVSFKASGTGHDVEDIKDVRLYFMGNTLLDTGAYSSDNGTITFNVNKTIPKSTFITLLMTYTFDERKAYPTEDYAAEITMAEVAAIPLNLPPGLKLPVPPQGVNSGPTGILIGNLVAESGNEQWGLKGSALAEPFVTKVYHQHPDTINNIEFRVSPGEWGQDFGSKLSNDEFTSHVPVDGTARGRDTLTLGPLTNLFGVEHPHYVEAELKLNKPVFAHTMTVFSAYVMGMEVTAQHDGNEDENRVDTFVSNIEAPNIFTLDMEIAPTKQITAVTFDLNGNVQQGQVVTPNQRYTATFDMADIDVSATMTVTATLDDGAEMQKILTLEAIPFPAWFDSITSISDSFTKEFLSDEEKYRVGFSYPVDFVWSDAVPGSVGMLGGLDFDIPLEFSVWADYYINKRSGFGGEAAGSITLLGQQIDADGSMEGSFNEEFEFERGAGQVHITTNFDLPTKGFSKTFPVSGVPVTVSGELGGNVEIYVNGSAVLNDQIEFEEATITPGVTITGNIAVSISAAFGVVEASVIGEPVANMEIEIHYTTSSGTTADWGGSVVVPIKIVGSLFWGTCSAELYSTELGPWTFGTGGASSAQSFADNVTSPSGDALIPDLLSSSSITSGDNQMVVWIADIDPAPGVPNPDVYYRYNDGTGWTTAAPVTPANDLWEMDPVVVSLGNGEALAAWTSNDGDHSLTNLNDILACQDIAYAYWNGVVWSTPDYIINDNESDGMVTLAYDSYHNKVVAAWLHDANSDLDMNTHTEWKILTSVYDPDMGLWTAPQAVPSTDGTSADFMPAVSSDALGNTFVLWVKDGDGVLAQEITTITDGSSVDYTNTDCDIYYSRWNGSSFSDTKAVTVANDMTEQSPAVAFAPDGDGVAAWVTKDADGAGLYYSIYEVSTGNWTAPGLVVQSEYFIEEPQLVIDSTGMATLVWRGYAGLDGDLFSSTFDFSGTGWSEPEQLTSDDRTDWHVAIGAGSDDSIIAAWSKNDFTTTDDSASSGFDNNIQLGQTNLDSAEITGYYTDNGTDVDDDGLYEFLTVTVETLIKTPGDYSVTAELHGDNKISEAKASAAGLPVGTHTFVLNFPGGFLSNRQADGPYSVKNVTLLDENMSPMQTDFADVAFTTSAYTFDQFVEGAVSIEKATYQGESFPAVITVRDNDLNIDPSTRQNVTVTVSSTVDPTGIQVLLMETDVDSGIFTAEVNFTEDTSDPVTGKIQVVDHATVLVTYRDTDPNYLWMDTAVWSVTSFAGDANEDGLVNALDFTKVVRIILEMDEATRGADANEDDQVNVFDLTKIARMILGLEY